MEFEAVIENLLHIAANAKPAQVIDKGLFVYTNEINGKQYVGKSNYLGSINLFHPSSLLLKDIQTKGKANFTIELIRYPDLTDFGLSVFKREKILELGSMTPNGYNQRLPQLIGEIDPCDIYGAKQCRFCGYIDVPKLFEYRNDRYFCKDDDCFWQWRQTQHYL